VKGERLRYIRGHNRRKRLRYVLAATGYKTDCWLWQLAKNPSGYGVVGIAAGKTALAHRAYYEERFGPVPEGMELDHLCRVRACVNPEHLEPVTHTENLRRGRKTKLALREVAAIRSSQDTQRVIARQYGITPGHVSRIRSGASWRGSGDQDCA
jgi:HNH endonuclease